MRPHPTIWLGASMLLLAMCLAGEPERVGREAAQGRGAGEAARDEAPRYLEQVAAAQSLRDEAIGDGRGQLHATYQTRERLWKVAEQLRLRAGTDAALDEAGRLSPPPSLEAAHGRWVAALRALREHLEDAQEALERRDLVGMIEAFMRSELALAGHLTEAPEGLLPRRDPPCRAGRRGGRGDGRWTGRGLPPRQGHPGGDYAEELYQMVLRTELQVGRRIGLSRLPAFTDEERLAYLALVQPEVERQFEHALETVRELDPRAGLEADHERGVRF